MWLVADIGGTHSRLMVADATGHLSQGMDLLSRSFASFDEVLTAFFSANRLAEHIEGVCLALAGPIVAESCQLTALEWPPITAEHLRTRWGWSQVLLLNDMVAHAWNLTRPAGSHIQLLHGENIQSGHRVLLIPGTGLGEAFLYWDGKAYHPIASEGGHCSLAPKTEQEVLLWTFMYQRYGEMSYNTLLGGQGMCLLYDFFVEQGQTKDALVEAKPQAQKAEEITERGLCLEKGICAEVLQGYLSLLVQEMVHCAFKHSPQGGILLSGNVLKKILSLLKTTSFRREFVHHRTHAAWLENIPIYWMDYRDSGIRGAASYLIDYLGKRSSII